MLEPHAFVVPAEAGSMASVIRVPQRWIRFLRRCLTLRPGRYMIVLSVYSDRCATGRCRKWARWRPSDRRAQG